jgi:hypothetical protein
MKQRLLEIVFMITVSYTILSMINTIIVLLEPGYTYSPQNAIMMLLFCTIGVLVLHSRHLFKGISPLSMIGIQYLIGLCLILMTIKFSGLLESLHKNAYRDGVLSFTIPYFIGALIYYIHLYLETKKHNRWIESIQKTKEI